MSDRNRNTALLAAFLAAATTGAIPMFSMPAWAQVPATQVPAPPNTNQVERSAEAVDLTMEQRHIIKEIIIKAMKIEPQPHAGGVPTRVGGTVPAGIPLQPMPVEVTAKIPQLKTHSFLVKDAKVIVIDPKNNKVAALVD
jgi:hypothetical protein